MQYQLFKSPLININIAIFADQYFHINALCTSAPGPSGPPPLAPAPPLSVLVTSHSTTGFFMLQVPVVPVVFSPYSNLNHEEKTIQPAVIKVSVLEPIRPKPEITDENEHVNILVSETRSRMLKEFQSS